MNRYAWMITIITGAIALTSPATAQVSSDSSTGTIVNQTGSQFNITGGTTVGGRNLFHSFDRFDIPNQGAANFLNDPSIANIFSRVTGGKVSEIDGVLRSRGSANFFLMNPSGIVFGQNASLNVGGSFVATTANGIQFGDRGSFSTSTEKPSDLLIVEPSAFLFSQVSTGAIVNRSISTFSSFYNIPVGLFVPIGQNLVLLGGNIDIDGGKLNAFAGNIEVGAVRGKGTVRINSDGKLSFPENLDLADVVFRNRASADTRYDDRGAISITARNINVADSRLDTGLVFGDSNSQAGNITLNATDTLAVTNSSIFNSTRNEGNGGKIEINAKSRFISQNATISTVTVGKGSAGNLVIDTNNLQILNGSIGSATFGKGNSGDVIVNARQIIIQEGGYIAAGAFDGSEGKGGNLTITASELIELIGFDDSAGQRFVSGISAETTGTGNAGTLRINTGRLLLRDGATIKTETTNSGRGGNLIINASESVALIGGAGRGFASTISSETDGGSGDAGDLTIRTNQLSVQDGAVISSGIRGSDNSPESELQINGAGGNIEITADRIDVFGFRSDVPGVVSAIFSSTQTENEKQTGNINIVTRQLSVRDGGKITTSTGGSGNAGSLTLTASDAIEVLGISIDGKFSSELSTGVIPTPRNFEAGLATTGQGGDLRIEANRLNVADGGLIYTATLAEGKAGNLSVFANKVTLQGGRSSEFSNILGIRGAISAQSSGTGEAGNINLNVVDQLQLDDSRILTSAPASAGGSIQINTDPKYASGLMILRNSDISTASQGDGGNITISGRGVIAFSDSNVLARSQDAGGGNITFNTPAVFIEGGYRPTPPGAETNGNNRVDIDASGRTSGGMITLPDDSLIQNSLNQLPQTAIDTNALLTNSCIARNQQNGTFFITGTGGLPTNPGDLSNYPTGTIQPTWKRGDTIVEPQGVYQLDNGDLVMSRECSN